MKTDPFVTRVDGPATGADPPTDASDSSTRTRADGGVGVTVEVEGYAGPGSGNTARILLGRYVMLKRIGAGGGGIVHRAYDPELDRKVAIKLLNAGEAGSTGGTTQAQARLLREAQAMARLSHPNVIAVHDVGSFDGEDGERGVYVVMELVSGKSLDQWIATGPHPWREVVQVFLQAARGMAAAHAQGLIHRDFKPSNAIVGNDGRVRVLDFGLARLIDGPDPSGSDSLTRAAISQTANVVPHDPALDSPLTMAGTVMGTPAYMSPEQHQGASTDARTDQYSLCVALYEALNGVRPFAGQEIAVLEKAKLDKDFAPARSGVPRWLSEVVARGLEPDPNDRFPDVDALIARLEYDPRKRIRRWLVGGVAAAAIGASAYGVHARNEAQAQVCAGAEQALEGVWDSAVKAGGSGAFNAIGKGYAAASWDSVERQVDAYVSAWTGAHRRSCEAAMVDGTQTMATMASEVLCLDRQLARLGGVTSSFAKADEASVRAAIQAVANLPDPNSCIRREVATEQQAASRDQILSVESKIADIHATIRASKIDDAAEQARELIEEIESIGNDGLLARALLASARVREYQADYEDAYGELRNSLLASERAADPETGLYALTTLVRVTGNRLGRQAEALRFADLAEAKLTALGSDDNQAARLFMNRGDVLRTMGRYDDAVAELTRARKLAEGAPRTNPVLLANIHNLTGVALDRQGRYHDALAEYQTALEMRSEVFGPEHPRTANAASNCAIMYAFIGEYARAEREMARAIANTEAAFGRDHPSLAWVLVQYASILRDLDRPQDALVFNERALDAARSNLPADHPHIAMFLMQAAQTLLALERFDQAFAYVEDAHTRQAENEDFPEHSELATDRAQMHRQLGRSAEALEFAREAVRLAKAAHDESHPSVTYGELEVGLNLLALDRHQEAIPHLERAVRGCSAIGVPELSCTQTWFGLARALHPTDPIRALSLARDADRVHTETGLGKKLAAEIRDWLDAHGGTRSRG